MPIPDSFSELVSHNGKLVTPTPRSTSTKTNTPDKTKTAKAKRAEKAILGAAILLSDVLSGGAATRMENKKGAAKPKEYVKAKPRKSARGTKQDWENGRGVSGTKYPQGWPSEMRGPGVDPIAEKNFQDWYLPRAIMLGLDINPDNPKHHYNYRGAYMYGGEPDLVSRHWPSAFKTGDHPNRYVKGVDTITGKKRK